VYERILVGVGKTESSMGAVDTAIDLAERYGAELHLVMVFDRSGGSAGEHNPRDEAEGRLATIQARTSLVTHIHVLAGDPADGLVKVADEVKADLVVVGNQGMQRRLLGSVPSKVAQRAGRSVLIVDTTG
jgi:nucleotide-binding universal stress UspA family protein